MGIVLTVDGAGHIIRPALSTAPPHPKRGGNLVKIGAVAQLGERYNGIVEVRGSIPLGSTIIIKGLAVISVSPLFLSPLNPH